MWIDLALGYYSAGSTNYRLEYHHRDNALQLLGNPSSLYTFAHHIPFSTKKRLLIEKKTFTYLQKGTGLKKNKHHDVELKI